VSVAVASLHDPSVIYSGFAPPASSGGSARGRAAGPDGAPGGEARGRRGARRGAPARRIPSPDAALYSGGEEEEAVDAAGAGGRAGRAEAKAAAARAASKAGASTGSVPAAWAEAEAAEREEGAAARRLFSCFCREWGGAHAVSVDADGFVELCRRLRLLARPGSGAQSGGSSGAVTAVVAEQIFCRCRGPGATMMRWPEFQRAMAEVGARAFPGSSAASAWLRVRRVLRDSGVAAR